MKKNILKISLVMIGLFSITTSAQANKQVKHGSGGACVAHFDGYGNLLRTVCANFSSTKVTKRHSHHAGDAYISVGKSKKINKTSVTLKDYH